MIKIITLFLVLNFCSSQDGDEILTVTSDSDCVYAIINKDYYDDETTSSEAYSDFIYYSENVQKRLTIPFHIVVNRLFKLDDHEIPKSKKSIYMYIFIKKDSHKPLILEGPSTDAGILQQISEYFGNSVIKTE